VKIRVIALSAILVLGACDTPPVAPAAPIACAAGTIAGQGSSAQANALAAWIRDYQIACPAATIAYAGVGSGAGIKTFLIGTGDFAGSDSPLTAADQSRADARCRTGPAVHLPMVVGPIALAYTIAGVGDLRLRPATVARIFAGTVTTWNDR
jgi:phosphate transport system substrate-binding protein